MQALRTREETDVYTFISFLKVLWIQIAPLEDYDKHFTLVAQLKAGNLTQQ